MSEIPEFAQPVAKTSCAARLFQDHRGIISFDSTLKEARNLTHLTH